MRALIARLVGSGLALGLLAGFAYTIDLGIGPMILASVGIWVLHSCWHRGAIAPLVAFTTAALPWLALHHAINFAVTGSIGPPGARPEFFQWPGSPFDPSNMTGHWHHATPRAFLTYALELLGGQRGILGHNLPLCLGLVGLPLVIWRCRAERPAVLTAVAWSVGGWLLYAATSNNYAGVCVSIRWLLPMLAPGYLVLALLLRERPQYRFDLVLLSVWGAIWASAACWSGPWERPALWLYWLVTCCGLIAWAGWRFAILSCRRRFGLAPRPTRIAASHTLPIHQDPGALETTHSQIIPS